MTQTRRTPRCRAKWATAALVLCAAAAGCGRSEPCGVPGVVEGCACADGRSGARVCEPAKTWRACDCSGAIALPNAVAAGGGGTGGAVTSGTGGGGGAAVSGSGGAPPLGDDDAGTEPGVDAGGSSGADAGGAGGSDAGGPLGGPYRGCMTASDCDLGSECIMTSSFPANAFVCSPACTDVGDCPVPEGMYEATVVCVTGRCGLDCTPVLFAALLSCPTGMTCIAPLLGPAYCHDDGM